MPPTVPPHYLGDAACVYLREQIMDNACVVHRLSNFERTQLRIILRFHYTGKFVAYLGGPGHQTPVIRSSPQDDVKDALADIPVN